MKYTAVPVGPQLQRMAQARYGFADGEFAVGVKLDERVALLPFGDHPEVGEVDLRSAGGAQQPRGRCMQVPQQSITDPMMRHRLEGVAHLREELRRAGALVAYARQLDRVDRGEPADRPAEVDIRPQHGSPGAGEVDASHAVTHSDCQAARKCCQQDLLGRGLQ